MSEEEQENATKAANICIKLPTIIDLLYKSSSTYKTETGKHA